MQHRSRGIAQLVEQRSPKPRAVSSRLTTPATNAQVLRSLCVLFLRCFCVLELAPLRSANISGKIIFICTSGKSADFPELLFHRWGRSGQQHFPYRPLFVNRSMGNDRSRFPLTKRKFIPLAMAQRTRSHFQSFSFYFFASFIRLRFSSRMRSSTTFTALRMRALGMRTASVAHG